MQPQTPLPDGSAQRLARLLKETKSPKTYKRIQVVYLRAKYRYSSLTIAAMTGYHQTTVKKIQAQYLKEGEEALFPKGTGGRYRENLSIEQEREFLTPYLDSAKAGQILQISRIHQDYEQKLGRPAGKSTIYEMLHRHEWRKVTPRPKHPKGDKQAQEAFKKTSQL